MSEPAIVCTLEGASFAERLAWIRQLFSLYLIERRQDDLRLHLVLAAEAADQVNELVLRERACCAFLEFEVKRFPTTVSLTIIAPEAARESAGFIFSAYDRAAPEEEATLATCGAAQSKSLLNIATRVLTGLCSCETELASQP